MARAVAIEDQADGIRALLGREPRMLDFAKENLPTFQGSGDA